MTTSSDAKPETAADRQPQWTKLTWPQRLAILVTLTLIAVIAIMRLPPGVCYGDSGDLQLASAALGIAHPPGYAGYATIGYVLTLVPWVDPAYMVSLGCLGAGIAAIALCMLAQVRLGLSPWIAAAVGALLAAQPRVWQNLLAPEVYAPSLALLAGSAYLLLKHVRLGGRGALLAAALLFGMAVANRPPAVFALPFFLVAWWVGRRRWQNPVRLSPRWLVATTACVVLPGVYSIGYFWLRDTPTATCNYIEQYNAEARELPNSDAGPSAKLRRVVWLARAAQYQHLVGNGWRGVWNKLRWLRGELQPGQQLPWPLATVVGFAGATVTSVAAAAVVGFGLVVTVIRSRPAAWLLIGMIVQSVVFVCAYRVYDQAADLLPLIWAATVAFGAGLAVIFPRELDPTKLLVAIGLMILTCGWTIANASERPTWAKDQDATAFLAKVNLDTFPERAVICSSWGTSPPLWYAQHVQTHRTDIKIINAGSVHWLEMVEQHPGRPVFFTDSRVRLPQGWKLTPFRKLWKLEGIEN